MKKTLSNIIIPTLDSNAVDIKEFENPKIYNGEIADEKRPPNSPACFQGAWYRKVYSSKDLWLGIEGTIILGEFIPDEKRFKSDGRISLKRHLDNPSIYMGGHALSESDAGLGFNVGYLSDDTSKDLDYGSEKIAYRPFWRYIYEQVYDENFQVLRKNINSWNVANAKNLNHYYFPGDKIKMSIYSPIPNYLQLKIDLIEPTKIEKYKKIRDSFNLSFPIQNFLSPLFYSKGHGLNFAEFKRVNSIDQFGNEGFVVSKTNAFVTEAIWEETYLYRRINGEIMKVPMTENRQTKMACPQSEAFTIKSFSKTGEKISIHPGIIK